MYGLNWNLLRSFVAVAEQGSLSAAGRTLDLSQPTVGRHIQELEGQLELALFERHPRGLTLTARGTALYEVAIGVRRGVDKLKRQAAGMNEEITGTVRVAASEVVAHFVLPSAVAEIRDRHPRIHLEIVADDGVANLLRRHADIAVRTSKPEQADLIAHKLADAELGLYASQEYLERYGEPKDLVPPTDHTFIGFDRDPFQLRVLKELGLTLQRETFALRSDTESLHVHAVVAGAGIGSLQAAVARLFPTLVRVMPDLSLPSVPVWLVAHTDFQKISRSRAVHDLLGESLRTFYKTP